MSGDVQFRSNGVGTLIDTKSVCRMAEAKAVTLQLTTCLGEEIRNANTAVKMYALESLYDDVVLRLKGLRGNVEWTDTERQGIVNTLHDYKEVKNANPAALAANLFTFGPMNPSGVGGQHGDIAPSPLPGAHDDFVGTWTADPSIHRSTDEAGARRSHRSIDMSDPSIHRSMDGAGARRSHRTHEHTVRPRPRSVPRSADVYPNDPDRVGIPGEGSRGRFADGSSEDPDPALYGGGIHSVGGESPRGGHDIPRSMRSESSSSRSSFDPSIPSDSGNGRNSILTLTRQISDKIDDMETMIDDICKTRSQEMHSETISILKAEMGIFSSGLSECMRQDVTDMRDSVIAEVQKATTVQLREMEASINGIGAGLNRDPGTMQDRVIAEVQRTVQIEVGEIASNMDVFVDQISREVGETEGRVIEEVNGATKEQTGQIVSCVRGIDDKISRDLGEMEGRVIAAVHRATKEQTDTINARIIDEFAAVDTMMQTITKRVDAVDANIKSTCQDLLSQMKHVCDILAAHHSPNVDTPGPALREPRDVSNVDTRDS
ncbi:hypothetical protein T484DRAFT_1758100, partial [Baffinella frigidus]